MFAHSAQQSHGDRSLAHEEAWQRQSKVKARVGIPAATHRIATVEVEHLRGTHAGSKVNTALAKRNHDMLLGKEAGNDLGRNRCKVARTGCNGRWIERTCDIVQLSVTEVAVGPPLRTHEQ